MRDEKINRYQKFLDELYKESKAGQVYKKSWLMDLAIKSDSDLTDYKVHNMIQYQLQLLKK